MVNRFLNSYKLLVFPVSVELCSEIMKVFITLSLSFGQPSFQTAPYMVHVQTSK